MTRSRHTIATLFAYNDFLWTLLAGFVILAVVLAATYQQQKKDLDGKDVPAGAASVYIFWPDGLTHDVDVHVQDPTKTHVYFRKMQGRVTNLLRDDQGMSGDSGSRNFENAYIRELIPGEYLINIHAFAGPFPVTVDAELNFLNDRSTIRFVYRVTLYKKGDEMTIFRFLIGQDGKLIPGSLNHLRRPFIKD